MFKFVNISIKFFIIFILIGLFFVLSTFWYFSIGLPDYKKLSNYQPPISSRVYSVDGKLIENNSNIEFSATLEKHYQKLVESQIK